MGKADRRHSEKMRRRTGQRHLKARLKRQAEARRKGRKGTSKPKAPPKGESSSDEE